MNILHSHQPGPEVRPSMQPLGQPLSAVPAPVFFFRN